MTNREITASALRRERKNVVKHGSSCIHVITKTVH